MVDVTKTINLSKKIKSLKDEDDRTDALEAAGEFLVTKILQKLSKRESPVKGRGRFKGLSKDYGDKKQKEFGNRRANLEAEGDLLSALEYRVDAAAGTVTVGVFEDSGESGKADGHNHWTGKPKGVPRRQFIPKSNQTFQKKIMDGVDRAIKDEIRLLGEGDGES